MFNLCSLARPRCVQQIHYHYTTALRLLFEGVGCQLFRASQVFEELDATFQARMMHLCTRAVEDSTLTNQRIAQIFLELLNRVAYSILPSAPQQVQHIASRGFRDWGIQTCTICDKLTNKSDGSQLTIALLHFLRAPKAALLLPNDALVLWKAAVQELNTLGAQSSQSCVTFAESFFLLCGACLGGLCTVEVVVRSLVTELVFILYSA